MSTIAICSPMLNAYNPASYTRSYEPSLNARLINRSYACPGGYNWDGTASYGDGSPEVAEVSNYFWADWAGTDSAEVITAPKDQFDSYIPQPLRSSTKRVITMLPKRKWKNGLRKTEQINDNAAAVVEMDFSPLYG